MVIPSLHVKLQGPTKHRLAKLGHPTTPLVEFGQSHAALLGFVEQLSVRHVRRSLGVCGSQATVRQAQGVGGFSPRKRRGAGSTPSRPGRKVNQIKRFA